MLSHEIWILIIIFFLGNLTPLVGFYFNTKATQKRHDIDIKELKASNIAIRLELKKELMALSERIDKFLSKSN